MNIHWDRFGIPFLFEHFSGSWDISPYGVSGNGESAGIETNGCNANHSAVSPTRTSQAWLSIYAQRVHACVAILCLRCVGVKVRMLSVVIYKGSDSGEIPYDM